MDSYLECQDAHPSPQLFNLAREGSFDEIVEVFKDGCHARPYSKGFVEILCEHGRLDVVKFLLENNPNYPFNKKYMVYCAVRSGNIELVEYLLSQGAPLTYPPTSQGDMLLTPAVQGPFHMVKYLIEEKHLDPKAGYFYPYQCAKTCNNPEAVEYLDQFVPFRDKLVLLRDDCKFMSQRLKECWKEIEPQLEKKVKFDYVWNRLDLMVGIIQRCIPALPQDKDENSMVVTFQQLSVAAVVVVCMFSMLLYQVIH